MPKVPKVVARLTCHKTTLLAQRIHFMSHLYSYVRSRPFSEWDGQGTFLQCTDRYTIWTSGSHLTGMNRIYLKDVKYRMQNGRSGFVRTHPFSNVVAISIKYTFMYFDWMNRLNKLNK